MKKEVHLDLLRLKILKVPTKYELYNNMYNKYNTEATLKAYETIFKKPAPIYSVKTKTYHKPSPVPFPSANTIKFSYPSCSTSFETNATILGLYEEAICATGPGFALAPKKLLALARQELNKYLGFCDTDIRNLISSRQLVFKLLTLLSHPSAPFFQLRLRYNYKQLRASLRGCEKFIVTDALPVTLSLNQLTELKDYLSNLATHLQCATSRSAVLEQVQGVLFKHILGDSNYITWLKMAA
jgi:hypothetical protein